MRFPNTVTSARTPTDQLRTAAPTRDDVSMDVTVGHSQRWRGGGHLVVEVANRHVLACTGGAADGLRQVPFDAVREELVCGPCRAFWKRTMFVPNA